MKLSTPLATLLITAVTGVVIFTLIHLWAGADLGLDKSASELAILLAGPVILLVHSIKNIF